MDQIVPLARREEIAMRISGGSAVNAADLAFEFKVSEDAIRRDLRALASEGRCRRVYGGALPPKVDSAPLVDRIDAMDGRKDPFGPTVADMIRPGTLVFLDSGSTNFGIVGALPEDCDLVIATNSVPIAAAVLRKRLSLFMIGGRVDTVVGGSTDAMAASEVSKLNIDLCLLGACAISETGGISTLDASDRAFKRVLIEASRTTVVLANTKKLGTEAPYRVADVASVDLVVVEDDAPVETIAELERAGAKIRRAAEGR